MKKLSKNRVLSLFLALAMIFMSFPISSVGAIESYSADDYAANVGAVAMFNTKSPYDVLLCDHPDNFAWDINTAILNANIPGDLELVITGCYINASDQLFYKVKAAPGHTLPEIIEQYPWIYQNDLGMDEESDALIIVKPADKEVVLEDSETGVTVTGSIPDDVELQVAGISDDKLNAVSNGLIDKSGFSEILSVSGKDITLLDGNSGKPWHPGTDRPVTVTVSDVWTPAGKVLPVVDVYHILDDAQAVEKAKSGGYLLTCEDPDVLALYPQEAALLDGAAVPYVRLPGIDGGTVVNQDGSITFETDSFSDYFIVLGFTDGLSLSNNGNDTYYVEPGTTLTFNRSVTWTSQGTPPTGITASGSTVTIGSGVPVPSDVTYTAIWSQSGSSRSQTVRIKIRTRNQIVSEIVGDTEFPVILSVVRNVSQIPSEPGTTEGTYSMFLENYNLYTGWFGFGEFAPSAEGIISPDISDVLIKSIDDTNAIGYADATGATILPYLSGIDWDKILDVAIANRWTTIDGKTITATNKNQYKVIPYVVKLMNEENRGIGWHIDCAIGLKDNVTLSYDMNLDNYQVSGKIKLPITASGIPTFSTQVNYLTHGLSDYNQSNLNVGSKINATYNGEQMTLTFKGWNTSPDGNGISYAPGSNISISEDTVLYAIWEGALVPGELYIYKTVTAEDGAAEPSGATYQFSIQFSTVGTYNYTVYNADGSTVFSGSLTTQGTIALANGQYAAFTNIPANTTYKVTENEGSYTTTFEGDSGVVRSGGRAVARFVNHYVYIEPEITINYIAKDGGSVTISSEVVKVKTGNAHGSTATAGKGYRFVGWYSDSDCTKLLSQESKYVPTKEDGTEWINGTTFYAKFEPDNTSLTIKKVYPDGADYSIDENQTFIFTIKGVPGTNTAAIDLTVTIHGSGEITITDLPIGDYVVTEQTEWSWRYEPTEAAQSITLLPVEINGVVFKNTRAEIYWLDGDSYKVNIFKKKEQ